MFNNSLLLSGLNGGGKDYTHLLTVDNFASGGFCNKALCDQIRSEHSQTHIPVNIIQDYGAITPQTVWVNGKEYTIAMVACTGKPSQIKLALYPYDYASVYLGLSNIYKNLGIAKTPDGTKDGDMYFGSADDQEILYPYIGQTIPIWLSTEPPPY